MELNAYIEQKHDEHLTDLCELLRIPSVSAQSQHKPDIERAAQWVADRLRRAGFAHVEIVSTKVASPGLRGIAERARQAHDPFLRPLRRPACRAAGTVDLAALRAHDPRRQSFRPRHRRRQGPSPYPHPRPRCLATDRGKLPINIKVLIEGEEEVGSESLWAYVNNNKAKLKADALVVSDTGMLARGVPSDHLRLAWPQLLRNRNHRPRAGPALRNFRRRRPESADDSQRTFRQAP